MLISNGGLGAALAAVLGSRSTVLMRGHGSTVVGSSVEQAVYRAVYAEVNAKLQMQARQLGAVTYLNANEAAKAAAINQRQNFCWFSISALWSRRFCAVCFARSSGSRALIGTPNRGSSSADNGAVRLSAASRLTAKRSAGCVEATL